MPDASASTLVGVVVSLLALVCIAGCDGTREPGEAEAEAGVEADAPDELVYDPDTIVGIVWQWFSTTTPVEQILVPEPGRYRIELLPDGTVRAQFDCNRGGGDYEIAPGKLTFGPLFSTRMACPPDSLDAVFLRDLQRVSSFFVKDGELFLELPVDSGTLRFRKARSGGP